METYSKPFNGYDNGADFWRDNVLRYGVDEATSICTRYLDMQVKSEISDSEKEFCRELFAEMYESTADKVFPARLVYPYDLKAANDRSEASYYHKNRDLNRACARAIDEAINASRYKTNHYNLELAAISVIDWYGFNRVNEVLAHQIQKHESDGRYSSSVKRWARHFTVMENTHNFLSSHATLIDDFAVYTRKLNADLGAKWIALPGQEENGESELIHGYEIIRSIKFSENQGFVIAHNPDACDQFVCWQFTENSGKRDYYWGVYGDGQTAIDAYNARLFVKYN